MAGRPDKNYRAPKGRLNSLASAYLGSGIGALTGANPEAKGADVNPGGIAQGLDEGTGEGTVNYGPPPASVLQPASANIQAPPSYAPPSGFWGKTRDVLSGGRIGANTTQANAGLQKLFYEGQVREALEKQALIDKLIAQEQQGQQGISLAEINNRAKADLESQTITGRDNSSRLNTALSGGFTDFPSYSSAVGSFQSRPDFQPAWQGNQMSMLQKQGFENAKTDAQRREIEAGIPGKALTPVGPNEVLYNAATGEHVVNRPGMSVPQDNTYMPASFKKKSFVETPGGVNAAVGSFGPMAGGYKFAVPSFTTPQQNPITPTISAQPPPFQFATPPPTASIKFPNLPMAPASQMQPPSLGPTNQLGDMNSLNELIKRLLQSSQLPAASPY